MAARKSRRERELSSEEEYAAQESSGSDSDDEAEAMQLGNVVAARREQQPEAPAPQAVPGGVEGELMQVGGVGILPPPTPLRYCPLLRRRRRLISVLLPVLLLRVQLPTFQFATKRKQRQDGRVLLLLDINGVLMQHKWTGTHQVW